MRIYHHLIVFTYYPNITTSTYLLNLTDIEYSSYGTETAPPFVKIYVVYDRVYEAAYSATLSYNTFSSSDLTLTVATTNSFKG